MGFFDKYRKVDNSVGMAVFPTSQLKSLINKWKPDSNCRLEKDYQNSLHKYLEKELFQKSTKEKKVLKRMYGDIVLGRNIIELKANFVQGHLDRLNGQVKRYNKAKKIDTLFLVICNVKDEDAFSNLKKEYMYDFFRLSGKKVVLIRK